MADIVKAGGRRSELVAKIFGAAAIDSKSPFVKSNIHFIHDYLANEKIPVIAEDLGNEYMREIFFFPSTGVLYSKRVDDSKTVNHIMKLEDEYFVREKSTISKETQFLIF
jgi:chemotaxis protein CheD